LRRVIITGDDFGLALPVNEAIVEAHHSGVLTAASLMVGASAVRDAVDRARRFPSLRVGLHLVLVEGRPVSPPEQIPGLVDETGQFCNHPVRAGIHLTRPSLRRQIETEIRAQFTAFRATGLELDHVNAHNHLHLHPTVLGLILKVGREYGMRGVRVPFEPPFRSWKATGAPLLPKLGWALFLAPWMTLMRKRLHAAGVKTNRYVFGMDDSGRMTSDRVLKMIECLPDGDSEIYFHPATRKCPETIATMPDYLHEQEFETLVNPAVAKALARVGAKTISYIDL
jgi:hopanoid biosynthesis associated protein HpnK